MRLVVALGGNALLRREQLATVENQWANIAVAATQLARVAGASPAHELLLTHGNGPQVGLLALQSAAYASAGGVAAYPLDVLDAESQGMLGYWLEQALSNALPPGRDLASLLTRVLVDPLDLAFAQPSKPIGPVYTRAQADDLERQLQWRFAIDGQGWRRVVPSPQPLSVPALEVIHELLARGVLVIAAGGGGIPVVPCLNGPGQQGVEAVIDKDLCSALLARDLKADLLIIATDVDAVYLDWGLPTQRALGNVTADELLSHAFAAGSMAPKVQAACSFVRTSGMRAAIGALGQIEDLIAGRAGTQVRPGLDSVGLFKRAASATVAPAHSGK